MKTFVLFVTSALLSGSFVLAVLDKDFRDNFSHIAVSGIKTLAVLAKNDHEKKDENTDKRQTK